MEAMPSQGLARGSQGHIAVLPDAERRRDDGDVHQGAMRKAVGALVAGWEDKGMARIAVGVLLLLCVACGQASQTKANTIVPGAGPRGVDMDTALAVAVNAPVDFRCSFQGGGKRAFVIYRVVSDQWKPMMSCNNGTGSDIL